MIRDAKLFTENVIQATLHFHQVTVLNVAYSTMYSITNMFEIAIDVHNST